MVHLNNAHNNSKEKAETTDSLWTHFKSELEKNEAHPSIQTIRVKKKKVSDTHTIARIIIVFFFISLELMVMFLVTILFD